MWATWGVLAVLRPAMWPRPVANAHFANLRDLNILWFIGSPTPTCGVDTVREPAPARFLASLSSASSLAP